jgi:hypothetical protein
LQELERLSEQGFIDLFYGDESRVSSEGYVPYGWQFPGEDIAINVRKGFAINIFGCISRSNPCYWTSTEPTINGQFLVEYLDRCCLSIKKATFLVLDNASMHRSKAFRDSLRSWLARGLFIYLFSSDVFSAYEYRRNTVAETQERMAEPRRLSGQRNALLCRQSLYGTCW